MNRPMQSDKRSSNTISKHPQSSMATFPNSVARVWPLWLEQASNVKVVVGDLFATPNLLKSHTERNLLSPYSNIRAVTSKLCACPSLCCSPRTTGHGHELPRAAMNSRSERYPSALCG